MGVGEVLGEAWKLYTKFFVRFFVIAIIVFAIVNLLNALIVALVGHGSGIRALLTLVTLIISIVGSFWLQGALVYAVDDVRDGKIDATVGQVFDRVRPHLGTLILAGILAGLGIAVGFVFLIVPGLILLTWWCLIVPAIVLEGKSVGESFGRSRELVRGHAWTVLGVIVLTGLMIAVAAGILNAIFSFLGPFLRTWIGGSISSAVVGPFFAVALTLMYFKLRDLKEPAAAAPVAPAEPAPADTKPQW